MLYPIFITKKTRTFMIKALTDNMAYMQDFPIASDPERFNAYIETLDIIKKLPLKIEPKKKVK